MRDTLVPINKKWNIAALLEALRDYPGLSNSERITFEYVMLEGVNDSKEDAHRLVRLIEGIPAKVNLIPFNEWPGAPYKRSSGNRIHAFADIIHNAGYASPIRTPRGEDIMAACGQLKSATRKAAQVGSARKGRIKAGASVTRQPVGQGRGEPVRAVVVDTVTRPFDDMGLDRCDPSGQFEQHDFGVEQVLLTGNQAHRAAYLRAPARG